MKFGIIIPAHNEAEHIAKTLDSLVNQSLRAAQIIVVDDGSTDSTASIISDFAEKHKEVLLVKKQLAEDQHLPGSKVIAAFHEGEKYLSQEVEIICKFDADLIFPKNYLESLATTFNANSKAGMVGGFCHIPNNGQWKLEGLTAADHIRGALKAYRKQCYDQIGGLKPAMGWDTVDELLSRFYGWQVITLPELAVKHLKPTGFNYNKKARHKQGQAFYRMRYRPLLTAIASLKLAWRKKSFLYFFDCMIGYLKAFLQNDSFLLTAQQGKFVRNLRYRVIIKKLIGR